MSEVPLEYLQEVIMSQRPGSAALNLVGKALWFSHIVSHSQLTSKSNALGLEFSNVERSLL